MPKDRLETIELFLWIEKIYILFFLYTEKLILNIILKYIQDKI